MQRPPLDIAKTEADIIQAIRTIYDPEIPVNIYDLGLIYAVNVTPEGIAHIQMTLTTPHCPEAQTLPGMVENVVNNVEGIIETQVEIVWEPPWTKENMSEEARLVLGMF